MHKNILLLIISLFLTSYPVFATIYEIEYTPINIPTEYKQEPPVSRLNSIQANKSQFDVTLSLKDVTIFGSVPSTFLKNSFSEREEFKFKVEIENPGITPLDKDNLNLLIIIKDPEAYTTGIKLWDISRTMSHSNLKPSLTSSLKKGDSLRFGPLSYQIPGNAKKGEWTVFALLYKTQVDSEINKMVSKEPIALDKFEFTVIDKTWFYLKTILESLGFLGALGGVLFYF